MLNYCCCLKYSKYFIVVIKLIVSVIQALNCSVKTKQKLSILLFKYAYDLIIVTVLNVSKVSLFKVRKYLKLLKTNS